MLDIGWVEILFIMGLALLIFGPKELPVVLRAIGSFIGRLRNMMFAFEQQIRHQADQTLDSVNLPENIEIPKKEPRRKKNNATKKTKK